MPSMVGIFHVKGMFGDMPLWKAIHVSRLAAGNCEWNECANELAGASERDTVTRRYVNVKKLKSEQAVCGNSVHDDYANAASGCVRAR
jgi:hypothetical protein